MTLALVLVLVALALLLARLRWHRVSLTVYLAAALAFALTGYGLTANFLLKNLQDSYDTETRAWGNHNIIVVLGAGSELSDHNTVELPLFGYGRLLKALELYRSCKAQAADCRILGSGGDTHRYGKSEAELYASHLRQLGVSSSDLLVESESKNTWQNAQFTATLLSRETFDHVFLVTSGVHLRRAVLYFSHFGIRARPIRADYGLAMPSLLPTAYNFMLADIALHEYVGMWRYHVYDLLGLNVRATQPGAP
jgi:uncharacterized SAM-binding protein YcdF (DUF218 family)